MNYEEALSYLEELAVFGIQLGLGRIEKLLSYLEMPQSRYRTVHVTGTNGKGSVSAMVAGILRGSSIRTGLYTSPHLMSYTERIQVDGQPISKQDFADCLSAVRVYVDQMIEDGEECPTQFEVLTAVAFFYFALRHVEYAVIEVGLGGLLDSTNVIQPEVSVITNVSMEHADKCGGTLEGIAHHKAGIIKEGVPVVTAASGQPLDIIRREAEEKHADMFIAGRDFQAEIAGYDCHVQMLEFTSPLLGLSKEPYELHLLGEYQAVNSATAIMTAELLHNLDPRITSEAIFKSLKLVSWPARFERMELDHQSVLLDGAHNPAGMQSLRLSLDRYFPAKHRVFLLGILKDKDMETMLGNLLRDEDIVIATEPFSERAASADFVAEKAKRKTPYVEACSDADAALARALELSGEDRLLIIAGSLYLVGCMRCRLQQRKGGMSE